jgi:prophage regulatory protein
MKVDIAQRRLIRLPEVCRVVGLSRSVIYARVKTQRFPAPIKIGYTSGWIESEVQNWIDQQIRATRGSTACELGHSDPGALGGTA